LDSQDLRRDLFGRLGGLHRQDLPRRRRPQSPPGLARARGFNRRIEREQIGLAAMSRMSFTTSPIFCAASAGRDLSVGRFRLVHRDPDHSVATRVRADLPIEAESSVAAVAAMQWRMPRSMPWRRFARVARPARRFSSRRVDCIVVRHRSRC